MQICNVKFDVASTSTIVQFLNRIVLGVIGTDRDIDNRIMNSLHASRYILSEIFIRVLVPVAVPIPLCMDVIN